MDSGSNHNPLFPEAEITGELFCPHCGIKLFSWLDGIVLKCPHLVFAYGWNDPDTFLCVRSDYARSFLSALLESSVYKECLSEDEMSPIPNQDLEVFIKGDFSSEDSVASLVASYCREFPERLFPYLLSNTTVIFKDDRLHSGVHLAIDLGGDIKD